MRKDVLDYSIPPTQGPRITKLQASMQSSKVASKQSKVGGKARLRCLSGGEVHVGSFFFFFCPVGGLKLNLRTRPAGTITIGGS